MLVTNLGDTAITMPLTLLTCCFLGAAHEIRLALSWGLTLLGFAGVVGALKLMSAACGQRLTIAVLMSPSGHTALSTAVYGALCLLIAYSSPSMVRVVVYAAGAFLIAGIAASRVVLGYHTPTEVSVGLVIGISAIACFRSLLAKWPPIALPTQRLAGAAIVTIVLLDGMRWPTERVLRDLARLLELILPWCN